jgi:hypothetical protein
VGRMVRKQMYIDDLLDHELARTAKQMGVSQAEVVRRAVGAFVTGGAGTGESRAMRELKEWWAEVDALGVGSGPEGRTWTREELHDRGDGRY